MQMKDDNSLNRPTYEVSSGNVDNETMEVNMQLPYSSRGSRSTSLTKENMKCDGSPLNVTGDMTDCQAKPKVLPIYLDLVSETSDRSSRTVNNCYEELSEDVKTSNFQMKPQVIPICLDLVNKPSATASNAENSGYDEISEDVRTKNSEKESTSDHDSINLNDKRRLATLGEEFERSCSKPTSQTKENLKCDDSQINVTDDMSYCPLKPQVLPVYLDLLNEPSDRSSRTVNNNSYEEHTEDTRRKNSEKNMICDFVSVNHNDKSRPESAALGEVYDCINEYDYIPLGDQSWTAEGKKRSNTNIRQLPSIPQAIYEPFNMDHDKPKTKKNISRRKCAIVAGTICLSIVLVLFVVGAVAITLVVVKKNSDDNRYVGITSPASMMTSMKPQSTSETKLSTAVDFTSISYEHQSSSFVEERVKNNKSDTIFNAPSFLDNSTIRVEKVIPVNGYIAGLTVLDNELFVVRGRSSQVSVYRPTNNFNFIRNISINGSSHLWAIVAGPRYNCLYISDDRLNVIFRYNLSNSVITEWSVGGDCYGLSLTSTDNVLVTLQDTKQIQEYTPDETVIREISLYNSSIERPRHSIQLSSDRFVVSHGGPLHRVCIVDTSGRIIQCYGGSSGPGVGQLNEPRQIAVDGYGNVLVADRNNNRVVLLSPSLTHLGYIKIPGYTLRQPYTLHLDEQTHRLYIGEWTTTGRVFVLAF